MSRPSTSWRPLAQFRDATLPKLDNLRIAERAGLTVPPTWWIRAAQAEGVEPPPCPLPFILRSASPTEDTRQTSNAGQFVSLVVRTSAEFRAALRQVRAALPVEERSGVTQGVVFAQPFLETALAGVAFTDGFYYERTQTSGDNQALTAGLARGEVACGHLQRNEAWSAWLESVYRVFRNEPNGGSRLDVEFAFNGTRYLLLQARPALFPIRRNETLSLANHKEILGDPPSPWIVSVLGEAGGQIMDFYAPVAPEIRAWEEPYAIVLAERAWMNFSVFFRLMDSWGAPRSFVTEGVGGETQNPADQRFILPRLIRSAPRLLRLQWLCLQTTLRAERALRDLDAQIAAAHDLTTLYAANVAAMTMAIRTNFGINGLLSGLAQLRKRLRLPNAARIVTQRMMEEYQTFGALDSAAEREAALERWLKRYGHRGPLESDPARPRFAELRETLARDLNRSAERPAIVPSKRAAYLSLLRPLFLLDERREWFRDELMRRWQTLRAKMLEEGNRLAAQGDLERAEDIFLLRGGDLTGDLRRAADESRARIAAAKRLTLPLTASRETLQALLEGDASETSADERRSRFPGIALAPVVFEGGAVLADDLLALLQAAEAGRVALTPETILVVPALEPSWAVLFPRVGGVVAEIGGELSHASILLREARKPALVNCAGIFGQIQPGERLRLDGLHGFVERIEAGSDSGRVGSEREEKQRENRRLDRT